MTLGSHQTSIGKMQVHITPRWIIECLGPFDLDPAAADPRPWDCATTNFTERDNGLRLPWHGRVSPVDDGLDIPEFLKIWQEERKRAWIEYEERLKREKEKQQQGRE